VFGRERNPHLRALLSCGCFAARRTEYAADKYSAKMGSDSPRANASRPQGPPPRPALPVYFFDRGTPPRRDLAGSACWRVPGYGAPPRWRIRLLPALDGANAIGSSEPTGTPSELVRNEEIVRLRSMGSTSSPAGSAARSARDRTTWAEKPVLPLPACYSMFTNPPVSESRCAHGSQLCATLWQTRYSRVLAETLANLLDCGCAPPN
jgi:hypothetical protein